jgi:hypothetical protein
MPDDDREMPVVRTAAGFRPEQLARIHQILKALGSGLEKNPGGLIQELDRIVCHRAKGVIAGQLAGPQALLQASGDGPALPEGTDDVYSIVISRAVLFARDYRGAKPESSWPWIRRIAFTQAVSWVRHDLVSIEDSPAEASEADSLDAPVDGALAKPEPAAKRKRLRVIRLDEPLAVADRQAVLASASQDDVGIELEGYRPMMPAAVAARLNLYRGNPEEIIMELEKRFMGVAAYFRTVRFAIGLARKESRHARCRDLMVFHALHFREEGYDQVGARFRINRTLAYQAFLRGRKAFLAAAKKLGTLPSAPVMGGRSSTSFGSEGK